MFSQASRDILTARGFRPLEMPAGSRDEQWACSRAGAVVSILHNAIERPDRRQFFVHVSTSLTAGKTQGPRDWRTASERHAVGHAIASLEYHQAFAVIWSRDLSTVQA